MSGFPALLALLLAGLALAGCGPFEEAEEVPVETTEEEAAVYEEEIRAVYSTVRAASERLADDTADPAQLEAQLEDALGRLDRADPPEDAMPEHGQLTDTLREAVDLSGALAAAGEPRPVEEVEQLRQALDEADDILAGLEAKGYDVRRRT